MTPDEREALSETVIELAETASQFRDGILEMWKRGMWTKDEHKALGLRLRALRSLMKRLGLITHAKPKREAA